MQRTIESEDCFLMRLGEFERVLIFNRDHEGVISEDKHGTK